MWVIPTLNPGKHNAFASLTAGHVRTRGSMLLARFRGQNCILPRLGARVLGIKLHSYATKLTAYSEAFKKVNSRRVLKASFQAEPVIAQIRGLFIKVAPSNKE